MTKTANWTEIAALYLALLDSNIDTDKQPQKKPLAFQWKYDFQVKYEITKIKFNGKVHEVRNGFIIYD